MYLLCAHFCHLEHYVYTYAEAVSTAAEKILQQGSEPQPSQPSDSASAQAADPPVMGVASWKGQQGVIGDLIHLWVSWSPQPCHTVLGLLQGALAQVPCQPLTGKKAQEPVHPYPGTPYLSIIPNYPVPSNNHTSCGHNNALYIAELLCGVTINCASYQRTKDMIQHPSIC